MKIDIDNALNVLCPLVIFFYLIGMAYWILQDPRPKDFTPERFNEIMGQIEETGLNLYDVEGGFGEPIDGRQLTEKALRGD